MAKDVVFESERFEKRQSMKRWLFPVVGILILAAIAIAVTLLFQRGSEVVRGDREGPASDSAALGEDLAAELLSRAGPGFLEG